MLRISQYAVQRSAVRRLSRPALWGRSIAPHTTASCGRHYHWCGACLAPAAAPRNSAHAASSTEYQSATLSDASTHASPPETASPSSSAAAAPGTPSQTDGTAQTAATPTPPLLSPSESPLRRLFTSWQQGVVASIGAVMGIGFLLYFLYTPVKEDTVHHTAVVASEALADARLKAQAVQLSKDVVLEVLRDPKSLDAAAEVVVQLLAREDTKIAVSSLLQSLFEDHYTQEVTKKFVLQVVQDPWIQDQLQGITEEQVRKLLRNPEVKTALSDFLLRSAVDSLEKPQFHYEVARAVRQSAASVFNYWWN